jgi:hypothetical protein
MDKIIYRLNARNGKFFPIYYDTRFLARQPNEPDKPNVQISDKCLEVATLCSGAFGLHSKSIKRVATANNIFISSLIKYFEAEVFTGQKYEGCINNQRFSFTPYIICIHKIYLQVAQRLKTYEEMAKGYQNPVEEIVNPVLSIPSESEIEQLKERNKKKIGNPSVPNKLQLYPPPPEPKPEAKSEAKSESHIIPVNTTDVSTESHVNTQLDGNGNGNGNDITHNISLDYDSLQEATRYISHTALPSNDNGYQIQTTATLPQINRLELLIKYSLENSRCKNPQAFIKCLREKGYGTAFKNYRIPTSTVTTAIDNYLLSLNRYGLRWKTLGIKPDTIFPYEKTKYDIV